jgi:hypothetical protein
MKGALALLCLVLVAPLLVVDVPPLLDYPNHLARAVVLAFGSSMYAPHWAIIPDLGTDLVLPPLLRVLPVHVAGRIVVACAVLLPVLGTVAYSRAVFGTRSLWPLGSVLVAYNGTLLMGFLNFVAGAGLALLLAAAWIAWRERYPVRVVALTVIGALALFFCHLMGLVFCVILVGGHELAWLWRHRDDARLVARRMAVAVAPLLLPLALYTQSPLSPVTIGVQWPTLADKLGELVMPFGNYLLPLDILTAAGAVGFVAVCAALGQCRINLGSGIAFVVIAVMFVVAPNAVKGTYLFDTRFIVMLGFLVFGAFLPVPQPRLVAAAFALLFLVRMAVLGFAWCEQRQDVADMRTTIASVRPGDRVMLAFVTHEDARAYWRDGPMNRRLSLGLPLYYHLPALLLIEHHAFWPYLFADPSQQPIETLPRYRELAEQVGGFVDYRRLEQTDGVDLCGFDDVLVVGAGGAKDLARLGAERLHLVAASDIAALFRVGTRACGVPVAGN